MFIYQLKEKAANGAGDWRPFSERPAIPVSTHRTVAGAMAAATAKLEKYRAEQLALAATLTPEELEGLDRVVDVLTWRPPRMKQRKTQDKVAEAAYSILWGSSGSSFSIYCVELLD